ncbi:hypothetical protein [Aeribacillus pallidus]
MGRKKKKELWFCLRHPDGREVRVKTIREFFFYRSKGFQLIQKYEV